MSAFKVDDLVKVTQEGSSPEVGFITSIEGPNSYTIEYLDNTSEQQVAVQRLKKGLHTTASGRSAILTDRRKIGDQYKYSVIYQDANNGMNGRHVRADMKFKSAFPIHLKGGRTRRSRKSKSKSRRRR
jgi:hypothetical protein